MTETFVDKRGRLPKALGPVARGVGDAAAHNRVGMEQTLAAIKLAAERVATEAR